MNSEILISTAASSCPQWSLVGVMSLLRYLKHKDGLPDPKGPLSSSVASRAIARANREVAELLSASGEKKKRGPYRRYFISTCS